MKMTTTWKRLNFTIDNLYDRMLAFSKRNPKFVSEGRFVSFAEGETIDPLYEGWQSVVLVSKKVPPPGRELRWRNIKCNEERGGSVKFGDPTDPMNFCWNSGYKERPIFIFWLRTAANLGDLLRGIGRRTSRNQWQNFMLLMRRRRSPPLTNHNTDVNILHFKELRRAPGESKSEKTRNSSIRNTPAPRRRKPAPGPLSNFI